MPAYFLFDVKEITDPDLMEQYRSRVFDVVKAFGGQYRTVGGSVTGLEGQWRPSFPVIIEFPTVERARAWYDSEVYRPLKEMRLAATRGDCILLDAAPR